VLAIILALVSAIGYGSSDFAALTRLRLAGLALAGACVALIAAGGAG
jgi:hypothetical protein